MAAPNGYVQNDTGTFIPATQRPDGSWRKARRVKEGYVPQDEMPLYESKGKQWAKNRPTLPVGMDPSYVSETTVVKSTTRKIPGLTEVVNDPTPKSTKKKKKKKSSESSTKTDLAAQISSMDLNSKQTHQSGSLKKSTDQSSLTSSAKVEAVAVASDPLKRIRNLKKKLQHIDALKKKIETGELTDPGKDQLDKIARRREIEEEIEDLELELDD